MIRNTDDKELKYFQLFFGTAVRITEDGKKSSPIRSDAYFPEWKPSLKADFHSAENVARSTFPARFLLKCVH